MAQYFPRGTDTESVRDDSLVISTEGEECAIFS